MFSAKFFFFFCDQIQGRNARIQVYHSVTLCCKKSPLMTDATEGLVLYCEAAFSLLLVRIV